MEGNQETRDKKEEEFQIAAEALKTKYLFPYVTSLEELGMETTFIQVAGEGVGGAACGTCLSLKAVIAFLTSFTVSLFNPKVQQLRRDIQNAPTDEEAEQRSRNLLEYLFGKASAQAFFGALLNKPFKLIVDWLTKACKDGTCRHLFNMSCNAFNGFSVGAMTGACTFVLDVVINHFNNRVTSNSDKLTKAVAIGLVAGGCVMLFKSALISCPVVTAVGELLGTLQIQAKRNGIPLYRQMGIFLWGSGIRALGMFYSPQPVEDRPEIPDAVVIPAAMQCLICHDFLWSPVTCHGHLYCNFCISTWIQQRQRDLYNRPCSTDDLIDAREMSILMKDFVTFANELETEA